LVDVLDVVVGRQSIFARNRALYGYELLFRPLQAGLDGQEPLTGDLMTSTVLFSAVGIGLNRLIGDRFVFCNADRGLLTGSVPVNLPPEQTVIEVLETVVPDDDVIRGCRRLSDQGFRLALDDFTWFDGAERLLEIADIVKLDLRITPIAELADLMPRLRSFGVELLAEKVESEQELQACLDLGFEYLQGYALARPNVIPGKILGPSKIGKLRMASVLLTGHFEIDELEHTISTDPGLTYQLLQMVGAGGLAGTRRRVRDVREALVMAGLRRIQNWAALLTMTEAGDTSAEDVTTALTRARMAELLAPRINPRQAGLAFTAGMLSAVDVLLGVPVEDLVESLSLDAELHQAAFGQSTPIGRLVRDVIDHLCAHPDPPRRSGLSEQDLEVAAMRALTWAVDLVHNLNDQRRIAS
jgi:c-di-GMP-related signal transduction protein